MNETTPLPGTPVEREADQIRVEPNPPDYPFDWTPQQRQRAYWFSVRFHIRPRSTDEWVHILRQADDIARKHAATVAGIMAEPRQRLANATPPPPRPITHTAEDAIAEARAHLDHATEQELVWRAARSQHADPTGETPKSADNDDE